MFDLGAIEILLIVVTAILVIGPKDMPKAMRTAGRWIGKVRKVSAHFRTGIDAMVREAELEDLEKQWKARNEEIMKRTSASAENAAGEPVMTGPPPVDEIGITHNPHSEDPAPGSAESALKAKTDARVKADEERKG